MKIRKFLFKFVDHENRQISHVEFDIHSSRVSEWTQNENDVEGFGQWMGRHARWEMLLKNEVKRLVRQIYFADANDFGDYILSKQYIHKEIKNVNMSEAASDEIRFRQGRLMEKYITKYVRGTKPQRRADIYNYTRTHVHYNYFLNDDMSQPQPITLRELTCKGNIIVIPQDETGRNTVAKTDTQRTRSGDVMNVRNAANASNTTANNNRATTIANTNRNVDLTPYTTNGTAGYNVATGTANRTATAIGTANRAATATATGNRAATATGNRTATGTGNRAASGATAVTTTGLGATAADLGPSGPTTTAVTSATGTTAPTGTTATGTNIPTGFGPTTVDATGQLGPAPRLPTGQLGGEKYEDKYMKYKKKYVDLKKNRRNVH